MYPQVKESNVSVHMHICAIRASMRVCEMEVFCWCFTVHVCVAMM